MEQLTPKPSTSFAGSGSERVREYYEGRFRQFGDDPRSFWGSEDSQHARFEILNEIGPISGHSVLDVGCGSGDLLTFLREVGSRPRDYVGCDLSQEIIELAREKHPQHAFRHCDVLKFPIDLHKDGFDYVLASGLFALEEELWKERTLRKLIKMFRICRMGMGANFLSSFSKGDDPESHYSDPGELLSSVMREITPKAILRHDYRQNDFTIFLYK